MFLFHKSITVPAYAKINLSLDVTGKRPDGYHNIESVMQSVSLHDTLTFKRTRGTDIVLNSDCESLSSGEDNLILRAVRSMQKAYQPKGGLTITLQKRIPMQAGLGGGSSDAAATLMALNRLFSLNRPISEIAALGAGLGADVPFCVYGGIAYCEGIGEKITPLSSGKLLMENGTLPQKFYLIKPSIDIPTPGAYAKIDNAPSLHHPDTLAAVRAHETGHMEDFWRNLGNVFEEVSLPEHEILGTIRRVMTESFGCDFVQMSGSGPTMIAGKIGESLQIPMQEFKAQLPDCQIFECFCM